MTETQSGPVPPDPLENEPVRRAVAWGLIVLGWIWVALTGGCTLFFLGVSSWSLIQRAGTPAPTVAMRHGDFTMLILYAALILGIPGVLIGWLVLGAGRALRYERRQPGLGWSLVSLGGLWTLCFVILTLMQLEAMATRGIAGQTYGPGPTTDILTSLVSLIFPAIVLTAGVMVLRIPGKRGPTG